MQITAYHGKRSKEGAAFPFTLEGTALPPDVEDIIIPGYNGVSPMLWIQDGEGMRRPFLSVKLPPALVQPSIVLKPKNAPDSTDPTLPECVADDVSWTSFEVSAVESDNRKVAVKLTGQIVGVNQDQILLIHDYMRFGAELDVEFREAKQGAMFDGSGQPLRPDFERPALPEQKELPAPPEDGNPGNLPAVRDEFAAKQKAENQPKKRGRKKAVATGDGANPL